MTAQDAGRESPGYGEEAGGVFSLSACSPGPGRGGLFRPSCRRPSVFGVSVGSMPVFAGGAGEDRRVGRAGVDVCFAGALGRRRGPPAHSFSPWRRRRGRGPAGSAAPPAAGRLRRPRHGARIQRGHPSPRRFAWRSVNGLTKLRASLFVTVWESRDSMVHT